MTERTAYDWLDDMEKMQGGPNGPSIRLRAAILEMENEIEVVCARLSREAEAKNTQRAHLDEAMFVLGMVDKNNRIRAGEKGKAWNGRFVVEEVRRVLALGPNVF